MDNGTILEDDYDVSADQDARLVSVYLLSQIRKNRPELFDEVDNFPPIKKKRKRKPNLKGRFTVITTRNNDSLWEDNLPEFLIFEKNMRVYQ